MKNILKTGAQKGKVFAKTFLESDAIEKGKVFFTSTLEKNASAIKKGAINGGIFGVGISGAKARSHLSEFIENADQYTELVPSLKYDSEREERETSAFLDSIEGEEEGFVKFIEQIKAPTLPVDNKMNPEDKVDNSIRVLAAMEFLDSYNHMKEKSLTKSFKYGIFKAGETVWQHLEKHKNSKENTDINKSGVDKFSSPALLASAGLASESGETGLNLITGLATLNSFVGGGPLRAIAFYATLHLVGRVSQAVLDPLMASYSLIKNEDLLAQAKEDLKIPPEYLTQSTLNKLANRQALEKYKEQKVKDELEKDLAKLKEEAKNPTKQNEPSSLIPKKLSKEEKLAKMEEQRAKSDQNHAEKEIKREIDIGKTFNKAQVYGESFLDYAKGLLTSEQRVMYNVKEAIENTNFSSSPQEVTGSITPGNKKSTQSRTP